MPSSLVSVSQRQIDLSALAEQMNTIPETLKKFETTVVQDVMQNLEQFVAGKWPKSHDDIFSAYTLYVQFANPHLLSLRAALLWEKVLSPMAFEAEAKLQATNPNAHLHKGSPLYNTATCYYVVGDFDRCYQFIAATGDEEERNSKGGLQRIVTGHHVLSRQILVDPLIKKLLPQWESDYCAITSKVLDEAELKSLFEWLFQRSSDAFHTIAALHRFVRLQTGPKNAATQHLLVRSIADVVLTIESTLRYWQHDCDDKLHNRMMAMFSTNAVDKTAFQTFQGAFNLKFTTEADRNTPIAVNWLINRAFAEVDATGSSVQRAGISAFLAVRLRNSLMHVLDDSLELYSDSLKLARIGGVLLAVLRLSKHGNEGTLNVLA